MFFSRCKARRRSDGTASTAPARSRPGARPAPPPGLPRPLALPCALALLARRGRGLHTAAMAQPGAFYHDILSSSGVYKYFVDGEWKESSSGKTVPVVNPTTQQTEYQVQGARPRPPAAALPQYPPPPCPRACAAAAPAARGAAAS